MNSLFFNNPRLKLSPMHAHREAKRQRRRLREQQQRDKEQCAEYDRMMRYNEAVNDL